ncbi:MAG: hypothetical protein QOJ10_302 [Chloroflexota bacterium]|nr:hypothetical protein [Chloroflexota bacterium]
MIKVPPLYARMRAKVPRALYLNFVAKRAFADQLASDCFQPQPLPADPATTLFTVLLFELEHARPRWAPSVLGELSPTIRQSNWRFYGTLTSSPEGDRSGVFFWRTVTDSRALTGFGLHLARCFPLRRAERMSIRRSDADVEARIEPGRGQAPALAFRGRIATDGAVPAPFRGQFTSFLDSARWIVDQHLSLTAWPREVVIQDMHLEMSAARFAAVETESIAIPVLEEFVEAPVTPLSCFWAEGLEVYLDSIRALPRRSSC